METTKDDFEWILFESIGVCECCVWLRVFEMNINSINDNVISEAVQNQM